MIELIDNLDKDIKRCEDSLLEDDFLEIVIVIEELHNKYKNNIEKISNIEKDVVWKYTKSDLVSIKDCLNEYRVKILKEENEKSLDTKIKDFKEIVKESEVLDKKEILKVLESIEEVRSKNLTLDEKWDSLKNSLSFIHTQERFIAKDFLDILYLAIK